MHALISAAARHPIFANLLMVILLVTGIWGFLETRREAMPEVKIDTVSVSVIYLGAAATEVEEGIVTKIENALKGIQGIKKLNGIAMEGIGTVNAELKDNIANKQQTINEIKDAINQITTFPKNAEKPQVQELVSKDVAFLLALHGKAPERTLRELAYDIKEELSDNGLSQVSIGGVRNYEISIEVSREALQSYNLTMAQVSKIVAQSSINLPSGSIRTKTEEYKIEIKGRRYTGKAFSDLVIISAADGTMVRLGQIAKVKDEFEQDPSIGRFNGEPGVLFTINRGSGEDTVNVAQKVKDYIKTKSLPHGMKLSVFVDFSEDVNGRIGLLMTNAWQGLLLLFFALWLFLDFRLSVWVTLGIPIAFAFTGIILFMGDHTINMISLFGLILVLGIVVDDAIVIGENVHVYQQRGLAPMDAAIAATSDVAWPVLAAVTTTILAFMPLFFVSGIMGKFIAIMPVVVVATLLGSLIEGLLILPAHLGHGKHDDHTEDEPKPLTKGQQLRQKIEAKIQYLINDLYRPAYHLALKFRYTTVALMLCCATVTFGLVSGGIVPLVMFPDSDTIFLRADVEFPDGSSILATKQAITRLETSAATINEKYGNLGSDNILVKGLYSEAGLGSGKVNKGKVLITLVGPEFRDIHSQKLLNIWREATGPIANVKSLKFSTIGGLALPVKDIQLFLTGRDLAELERASTDTQLALRNYAGVYDVESDLKPGKRELDIELKPLGRALGITLQDLAVQLREGFYGAEALKVQRGRDEVKVQIRYPQDQRASLSDLYQVKIRTPSNAEVPFTEIASVTQRRGLATILHRNGKRRAQISASVNKTSTTPGTVLADLHKNFLPQLAKKYPSVKVNFEGADAESQESLGSLAAGFLFAAFGIYAVLAIIFRSYLQPLLIMVTIPLGLVGAILGHFIMGYPLTMLSLFGVIALAGVVVNDSLVLIDRINQSQRDGKDVLSSVQDAGPSRFRAIILTSVTTVAGLLPLLLEHSYQAQDLQPMALSLAAGLIFATVLTLFLIPCLYLVLNDLRRLTHWFKSGNWPAAEAVEPVFQEMSAH